MDMLLLLLLLPNESMLPSTHTTFALRASSLMVSPLIPETGSLLFGSRLSLGFPFEGSDNNPPPGAVTGDPAMEETGTTPLLRPFAVTGTTPLLPEQLLVRPFAEAGTTPVPEQLLVRPIPIDEAGTTPVPAEQRWSGRLRRLGLRGSAVVGTGPVRVVVPSELAMLPRHVLLVVMVVLVVLVVLLVVVTLSLTPAPD